MLDRQPDLELHASQLGHRQPLKAFAQRRAGDGDRVDAVGLAAITTGAALTGHQPGRDADDTLAVDEQEPLEGTGDVATVLERRDAVLAQAAGPGERRGEHAVSRPGWRSMRRPARAVLGRGGDERRLVSACRIVRARARSRPSPASITQKPDRLGGYNGRLAPVTRSASSRVEDPSPIGDERRTTRDASQANHAHDPAAAEATAPARTRQSAEPCPGASGPSDDTPTYATATPGSASEVSVSLCLHANERRVDAVSGLRPALGRRAGSARTRKPPGRMARGACRSGR